MQKNLLLKKKIYESVLFYEWRRLNKIHKKYTRVYIYNKMSVKTLAYKTKTKKKQQQPIIRHKEAKTQ